MFFVQFWVWDEKQQAYDFFNYNRCAQSSMTRREIILVKRWSQEHKFADR